MTGKDFWLGLLESLLLGLAVNCGVVAAMLFGIYLWRTVQ